MAIRTDFTAGEVLAAADLNDTFAAKANLASPTFTGTPAAPTAAAGTNTTQVATTAFVQSAGGLVLVTPTSIANTGGSASATGGEVTFTNVTAISLNGVFTSAYQNYRVVGSYIGSGNIAVSARYRVGGADNTASLYTYQTQGTSSTTVSAGRNTNGNLRTFFETNTTSNSFQWEIRSPNLAQNTSDYTIGTTEIATVQLIFVGGGHNSSTVFDGFSIFPNSGNITGTVRVYGYRNQ